MTIEVKELIAEVAYDLCRAYSHVILEERTNPAWEDAPDWRKQLVRQGVEFICQNPAATIEEHHEKWLADRKALGWTHGEKLDEENKKHPHLLPAKELHPCVLLKHHYFRVTVKALLYRSGKLYTIIKEGEKAAPSSTENPLEKASLDEVIAATDGIEGVIAISDAELVEVSSDKGTVNQESSDGKKEDVEEETH